MFLYNIVNLRLVMMFKNLKILSCAPQWKTGVINIPQRFLITKWGEDIGIINKSYDVGDLYSEAGSGIQSPLFLLSSIFKGDPSKPSLIFPSGSYKKNLSFRSLDLDFENADIGQISPKSNLPCSCNCINPMVQRLHWAYAWAFRFASLRFVKVYLHPFG